ncbi:MAG: apolipoprotein N-acyltransferase [Desulfovibrionaceae bacterium]|nr:apolipoprotein N-acyltransferase [Desulfovibrionaceae bacterium]
MPTLQAMPKLPPMSKLPFDVIFFCLLGSVGQGLGFPNDFCTAPWLIFLWPLALSYLAYTAPNALSAARRGFCTGFLGKSWALYWLALPMQEVGGLPFWGAELCALSVAACLALCSSIFTVGLYYAKKLPRFAHALFGALLWGLIELVTDHIAGFPWLPLSGALIVYPELVQSAAFVGSVGTSSIWVLLLYFLTFPRTHKKAFPLLRSLGLFFLVALTLFGVKRLNPEAEPKDAPSFGVLFVEGNVDQNQKWLPATQRQTLDHYIELSQAGLKQALEPHPLIIWPETALPFIFEKNRPLQHIVRDFAKNSGCPLLFGAPGCDLGQDKLYNRATLLDPTGATIGQYAKEHLVPFGEYTPSWLNFAFLEPLLQGVGVFSPGANQEPINFAKLRLGMLICYEGIFPELAQKRVAAGANILIDISNDSWFGETPAARQHLYLTCLRAIEQERWILRGTNSGISAVIDHLGRIVVTGARFQAHAFYAKAQLHEGHTFYHQFWAYELAVVSVIFLVLSLWILKRHKLTFNRQHRLPSFVI